MLRHCTIDELLELRDGEGSAAARAHLAECEACRTELERLHQRVAALKALPTFSPPRDRWPLVRGALQMSKRHSRWQRAGWGALAAAAVLVLLVGIRGATGLGVQEATAQEVDALVTESQELEQMLQALYRAGRPVDGMTAAAIADLEDRIAIIDLGIERAQAAAVGGEQMADLWRERVALMDQLVNTHVGRAVYVGY